MLKKIAVGFIILIVIIAGAGNYLWSNLDSYVKAAVEKYGSQAIKTEVKLDSARISVTSGEGALNGLSVGNPKGFQQSKAFYMGSISLKLDTSSLTGNGPVIIREIVIEKPQLTYEVNAEGANNLQTIQRSAETSASTPGKGNGNAATDKKGNERKFIINDLYIQDGQITITQDLLAGKAFDAPLPAIHLTNLGKQQGGATPAQIAEQVLGSLADSASKVATDEITKNFGASLNGSIDKNIGKIGGGLGNQLKGVLGR